MRDTFKDREAALENEYFRRKEQEALARLRAKMQAEAGASGETGAAGQLQCPRDGGAMVAVMMDEVQVDRCTECGGLWLDAGELEQLTHRDASGGFFDRMRRTITGEQ